MLDLVARTGRHQQLYEDGYRLIAGCIPFRYRECDDTDSGSYEKILGVLMISYLSGPGLLFRKGGWENDEIVEEAAKREAVEEAGVRGELMDLLGHYYFKNKTQQDKFNPEGSCKAAVFAYLVTEEFDSWPEQNMQSRSKREMQACMDERCLENGFSEWHEKMVSNDYG